MQPVNAAAGDSVTTVDVTPAAAAVDDDDNDEAEAGMARSLPVVTYHYE